MFCDGALGDEVHGSLVGGTSVVNGSFLGFSKSKHSGSISVAVPGKRCYFDLPELQEPISHG